MSLPPIFSQTNVKGRSTVSLGLLLIASSAFGAFILATDDHLWEHAPDHAYTLIGFVFIDVFLLSLLRISRQIGIRLVSLWGSIQAVVTLADVLTAPQFGFSYFEFALDLYGNWAFDALLLARILQAIYPRIVGTSQTFKVTFGRDHRSSSPLETHQGGMHYYFEAFELQKMDQVHKASAS